MNATLRIRSLPMRFFRGRASCLVGRRALEFESAFLASPQSASPLKLSSPALRQFHGTSVAWKDYPEHEIFAMPALSPTMESGTIAAWALKEGDSFSAGSVLCSVETDKATMDFEAQDDGVLARILKEGASAVDIPVGSPIAIVIEDVADVAAFADYVLEETSAPASSAAAEAPAPSAPTSTATTAAPSTREVADEFVLLPSARFLAESKGLDATGLPGTGKGGRVTKGDVLLALSNGTPMPALAAKAPVASAAAVAVPPPVSKPMEPLPNLEVQTFGGFEDVANNNMRKVIAKRLTESKSQVPHFYSSVEVELDQVMKMRKELLSKHDIKVSVNDVIIRCAALALRDVPEVNGTYDSKSGNVRLNDTIDVSVAVATPTGLITPIVPHTDKLGLSQITDKVRDLAGRARDGKLAPEEYQGGTFCISNLGMFGIDEFSAVINPPQAAILAVGGGSRRVVPTPYVEGADEQAKPSIKTIMTARLSADRRVVDEATAALFLSAFNHYISKPELLML